MGLYNGFGQRKAKTDALGVLGKTAAVKAFENMGKILWMNAAAVVCDKDLYYRSELSPLDMDVISLFRMVKGILDDVADSL